jgi:transposase-like protein
VREPASAGSAHVARGSRERASELTTDQVVHGLFPKHLIEKAKRAASGSGARNEPRFFTSPSHTEARCRAYLEQLRWPDGVRCPRCDAIKGISRIESRGQFECEACGYQFSVRVGTIFHASHLPLWKWFLAVYIMSESDEGVSENQLKRMLGVSYKTAWYLSHRIRSAMKDEAVSARGDGVERGVAGSVQHLSPKHLPAYLDEIAYRYKNRGSAHRFRDMLQRLIGSDSISYTELIASA